MESLANKYRPKTFEEVCDQSSIVKILNKQIETNTVKNAYLFCGSSGTGKTTLARVFANKINSGRGSPIEVDAASNNGVENTRNIIQMAAQRSLDSEYKIVVMDECHSLTNQSWQTLLKTIEEPPKYTIFIFCTTDPQKVPDTIINRCMRFNLGRISTESIYKRLCYISQEEGFINYEDTCDYISKICKGQMRDAISLLEKVSSYSKNLSVDTAVEVLGNYTNTSLFKLFDALVDGNKEEIIKCVDAFYSKGSDLRLFTDQFLTFLLDLEKYILFNTTAVTNIPNSMEEQLKYSTNFAGNTEYINHYIDEMFQLKLMLKDDSNEKTTITLLLLNCANWTMEV